MEIGENILYMYQGQKNGPAPIKKSSLVKWTAEQLHLCQRVFTGCQDMRMLEAKGKISDDRNMDDLLKSLVTGSYLRLTTVNYQLTSFNPLPVILTQPVKLFFSQLKMTVWLFQYHHNTVVAHFTRQYNRTIRHLVIQLNNSSFHLPAAAWKRNSMCAVVHFIPEIPAVALPKHGVGGIDAAACIIDGHIFQRKVSVTSAGWYRRSLQNRHIIYPLYQKAVALHFFIFPLSSDQVYINPAPPLKTINTVFNTSRVTRIHLAGNFTAYIFSSGTNVIGKKLKQPFIFKSQQIPGGRKINAAKKFYRNIIAGIHDRHI